MQRAKSSTPSIVCLRARAPMPGAVATTAHLATIVIANLAHLATEASRHIAANMGGHGIPGGERRNGIHAVTTSCFADVFAGFTEQMARLIPRGFARRVEGRGATNLGDEERLMRHFLILAMAYGCVVASPAEAAQKKKGPPPDPFKACDLQ